MGALGAPFLHRALSPYASMIAAFWVLTALTPLAAWANRGYLLGALFFALALLPPTTNTAIVTRQLLLTPDELRGRLTSVLGLAMGVSATVGPLLGGLLTQVLPDGRAVLVCAGGMALVTILVTVSPTLRAMPREPETHSVAV